MEKPRRALLIGVSTHTRFSRLPAVVSDIAVLSDSLSSPEGGFFNMVETSGLTNQSGTKASVMAAIETFFSCQESAFDLLYIASHALVDTHAKLRIVPTDYDSENPLTTTIPLSFVSSCLQYARNRSVVVVLDCCYADRGAYELFNRQSTPFDLPPDSRPNYCFISSTRSLEPAIDGGFTPFFANAIKELEPLDREPRVDVQRLFEATVSKLRSQTSQQPRLWRSADAAIGLGRSLAGVTATKAAVMQLYGLDASRSLRVSVDPASGCDYIEETVNEHGFRDRTGLLVLEGQPTVETVRNAVSTLSASIARNQIRNGMVVVTDARGVNQFDADRVKVRSFTDLRRSVLPVVRYLESAVRAYEEDPDSIYVKGGYVPLNGEPHAGTVATRDSSAHLLDEHIRNWLLQDSQISLLLLLGEFGAGKTTTARRFFWEQAKRFLAFPATERLPVFVRLREFASSFDIEILIERSVRDETSAGLTFSALRALNAQGRVFWILDGFDEMAVRVTEPVLYGNFEQIMKLSGSQARILVTCRPSLFKQTDELGEVIKGSSLTNQLSSGLQSRHHILSVAPLSKDQIRQFVALRLGDRADKFIATLEELHELRDISTRPILLEMVVMELPDMLERKEQISISSLYRSYTKRLLKRDEWRFAIHTVENREGFCQHLAWHFFSNDKYEVTYRELPLMIKEYFPEAARSAEEFETLQRAIQATSFLTRDDKNNFSFTHKSFLEFFAAAYVHARLEASTQPLKERVLPAEIVRFLADMLAGTPAGVSMLDTLVAGDRFSVKNFFTMYLAPRVVPVRSSKRRYSYVQRQPSHRVFHLALPVALIAVAAIFVGVPSTTKYIADSWPGLWDLAFWEPGLLGSWLTASSPTGGGVVGAAVGFIAGCVSIVVVYFLAYAYRCVRRLEGDPIQRFNVLACGLIAGRAVKQADLVAAMEHLDVSLLPSAKLVDSAIRGLGGHTSVTSVNEASESDRYTIGKVRPLNALLAAIWCAGYWVSRPQFGYERSDRVLSALCLGIATWGFAEVIRRHTSPEHQDKPTADWLSRISQSASGLLMLSAALILMWRYMSSIPPSYDDHPWHRAAGQALATITDGYFIASSWHVVRRVMARAEWLRPRTLIWDGVCVTALSVGLMYVYGYDYHDSGPLSLLVFPVIFAASLVTHLLVSAGTAVMRVARQVGRIATAGAVSAE